MRDNLLKVTVGCCYELTLHVMEILTFNVAKRVLHDICLQSNDESIICIVHIRIISEIIPDVCYLLPNFEMKNNGLKLSKSIIYFSKERVHSTYERQNNENSVKDRQLKLNSSWCDELILN